MNTVGRYGWLTRSVLFTLVLVLGGPVPCASATESDAGASPDARRLLGAMGEFLAARQSFAVTVQSSYDAVQADGTRLEFAAERQVLVARPNGLRVESREGDGASDILTFDGRLLTVARPAGGIYAQVEHAGDIDSAVVHFVRDQRMRLPLAMLLMRHLPAELERRVESVAYVEEAVVDGGKAHHLAGSTDSIDFQLWIRDGAEPLPLRVVLTYRLAEGKPSFRADLSGWNLAPGAAATEFTYQPPAGAQRIAFMSQVKAITNANGGNAQ